MRFFAKVFILAILVPISVCRRKQLAVYREATTPYPEDDDGKDRPDDNNEFQTIANKPDDGKPRVIYPTEPGETVRGNTDRSTDALEENIKIPDRLLIEMSNIHSVDEFLNRFVARRPDNESDDSTEILGLQEDRRTGITSRKGLSGGIQLAVSPFANCQPQRSVVEIEKTQGDGVLLWPPCIYLQRCGGCCTSDLMMCRPTATSTVNVTVLQARYTGDQSSLLSNEGVRIITMEQHDKCVCDCRVLPEDCNEFQQYRKNECRCVCSDQNTAIRCQQKANKFWDSRECVCKCRSTRDCSSGLFFNVRTCRCEAMRLSLAAIKGYFSARNKTQSMKNHTEISETSVKCN